MPSQVTVTVNGAQIVGALGRDRRGCDGACRTSLPNFCERRAARPAMRHGNLL